MDTINKVKKDYTIYGLINTLLYLFGSFLLLPFLQIFGKIKISLLNYVVWYVWSIAYTMYVLYILRKGKSKQQSNIEKVTYNWFVKGGFSSYQDMFLLSEIEPLYEYAILGVIILIPVSHEISLKRKTEIVLYKIALFHITASLLLMDWKHLIINYKFRKISHKKNI
jgi:hypothetical protein